jgi:catechol 2,3-dioxygenase-like lactoylglutathione lyase family enzyme
MGPVRIDRLDHLVLTVADIDATVEFYTRVLGMKTVTSSSRRLTARRPAAPTSA